MKVPLEWLKEYVAVKLTARQLAERLTMAGLEVTGVSLVNREEVLDLEVTPNRADCLSIIGIAREVAAILGEPLKASKLAPSPTTTRAATSVQHAPIRIAIDDRKGCLRYIGRLIDDVRVGPSPDWMQKRLTACGLRPINNIVDVTNYVLLECGQPLHAFDSDRLAEHAIIVRRARPKEPITTLDGMSRTLMPEILVIADARQAVAIAGVMGGTGSEVTSQTRSILLESALFDPVTVRRTARELGLTTESSYRFERGVDPVGVETASARAAALITKVAGGTERAVRDVGTKPAQRTLIPLDAGRLARWLGMPVPPATVRATLASLGCRVASGAGDTMQVSAPSFRRDLAQSVDVFEEVARLIGYDRIPARLPVAPMALPRHETSSYASLQSLRCLCASLGLTEVITWALVSAPDLERGGHVLEEATRLANPLSQDHAYLRPSLRMGLLQALRHNLSQGAPGGIFFEVGRVFQRDGIVKERQHLGVALCGPWSRDWRLQDPCDFFRLKGLLETLTVRLCRTPVVWQSTALEWAEPGQAAEMLLNSRSLGTVGQVARRLLQAMDIEQDVWVAELAVDELLACQRPRASLEIPSAFPPAKRDLSIVVDDDTPFASIHDAIREVGGRLATQVALIDRYAGRQIPPGRHSLTFAIEYRDPARTLTAEEVDDLHRRIGETLVSRFHAQLR
ncbi:MAG: phenylalanine--tRNA ligase subunit beta [Candidatus Omnitrophica bacterium]|nr:phenylalanine--tRNA ligase subunit beta [Candidatus Omnitrophota bacterium]